MSNCTFCNDQSIMPYKCSLCSNRYCGKHRLPESHECRNIGVFQTPEYRKQKIHKMKNIKVNSIDFLSDDPPMQSRIGSQGFWTSGNDRNDAFYGGLIIGLIASLQGMIQGGPILLIPASLFFGGLGLFVVYAIRQYTANQRGFSTRFVIWPVGVAISLVTSLFRFSILSFGFFLNQDSNSDKSEAEVGIITIITTLSIFYLYKLLAFSNLLPIEFSFGVILVSRLFLFLSLFYILPWRLYDGRKIYDWNQKVFWFMLIIIIFIFLIEIRA